MALKTELLDYWKWIGESIIARILKSVSIDCKKREKFRNTDYSERLKEISELSIVHKVSKTHSYV